MNETQSTIEKHVTIVGILHIGKGALMMLIGLFIFLTMIGVGFLSRDREAMRILPLIALMTCGILTVTSLPGLIGGIGVLKHKNWARILLMVVAAMDLLNVPVGTAIGVYTLWALIQDEVEDVFRPAVVDE